MCERSVKMYRLEDHEYMAAIDFPRRKLRRLMKSEKWTVGLSSEKQIRKLLRVLISLRTFEIEAVRGRERYFDEMRMFEKSVSGEVVDYCNFSVRLWHRLYPYLGSFWTRHFSVVWLLWLWKLCSFSRSKCH